MNILKVSELVEGKMYACRLSGLKLLARKTPTKVVQTMQGNQATEWHMSCMYFNPQTGSYQQVDPIDNQLVEISQDL